MEIIGNWFKKLSLEEEAARRLEKTVFDSHYCYSGDISKPTTKFKQCVEIRFVKCLSGYREMDRFGLSQEIRTAKLKYETRVETHVETKRVNLDELGEKSGWKPSVGGAMLGAAIGRSFPAAIIGAIILGGEETVGYRDSVVKENIECPFLLIKDVGNDLVSYTVRRDGLSLDGQRQRLETIQAKIEEAKNLKLTPIIIRR